MNSLQYRLQEGVSISDVVTKHQTDILSPAALQFIVTLEREFGERRRMLLKKREERQSEFTIGKMPAFGKETDQIRTAYWKASPIPYPLLDRRTELVGPPDKKTIVDALNSIANIFVADFEDTFSPLWENVIEGHCNIHDAIHGSLLYVDDLGNQNTITQNSVTLMIRPRGWHAVEKHILIDGKPVSASLFDFGMFVFHNTQELRSQGKGPYCYLPKMENQLEAKLWNDVFLMAQDELKVPIGTIKATASIETLPAAFCINEILYELREHCVGLQCNWWNYVFNFMKSVRYIKEYVIPDITRLSAQTNFLSSLSLLVIQSSHKRGVHAIAGPSGQLVSMTDGPDSKAKMIKVMVDKSREAEEGFDGSWTYSPATLSAAKIAFDEILINQNQVFRKRDDATITDQDLLSVHRSEFNNQWNQSAIRTLLEYIASWLNGKGWLVQKEDIVTATEAEIARSHLWSHIHSYRTGKPDDQMFNDESFKRSSGEELKRLIAVETRNEMVQHFINAKSILDKLVLDKSYSDFISSLAYNYIE